MEGFKKVTKEEFYNKLPKEYKYISMMGDPPKVCYYTGNWDDETFKKVGSYTAEFKPYNEPEEYHILENVL